MERSVIPDEYLSNELLVWPSPRIYVGICMFVSTVDCVSSDKRDTISYVIINPSYDVKLEPNDIM